ncbi:hypothetical protein [Paenibacillus sp. 8b26]|uniref:hypothetical protein n=1 Tax=Paenibacillus sp. 8b26 TaxID=3424133 RepID=UPI003D65BB44
MQIYTLPPNISLSNRDFNENGNWSADRLKAAPPVAMRLVGADVSADSTSLPITPREPSSRKAPMR